MTAQVAIANTLAVALASDSAVTISGGDMDGKTNNTANKLFTLSKYHPIGVMVNNRTDILKVPWEIIIKQFRSHLRKKSFNTVSEYLDAFVVFIEEFSDDFFKEDQKSITLSNNVFSFLDWLYENIKSNFTSELEALEVEQPLTHEERSKLLQTVLNQEIDKNLKSLSTVENFERFDQIFLDSVKDNGNLNRAIDENIDELKNQIPEMLDEHTIKLKELFFLSMVKPHDKAPWYTEIVLAGFGEKDLFPVVYSVKIYGFIGGKLMYHKELDKKVSPLENTLVQPFAQNDMVNTFMWGINDTMHNLVNAKLENLFPDSTEKTKEFNDWFVGYQNNDYRKPLIGMISMLSVSDLATLAESLVSLTSLKSKLTARVESVSGPVDVAVISKSEGVVWIKRKHYFSPELNHSFFKNYLKQEDE